MKSGLTLFSTNPVNYIALDSPIIGDLKNSSGNNGTQIDLEAVKESNRISNAGNKNNIIMFVLGFVALFFLLKGKFR